MTALFVFWVGVIVGCFAWLIWHLGAVSGWWKWRK